MDIFEAFYNNSWAKSPYLLGLQGNKDEMAVLGPYAIMPFSTVHNMHCI